MSQKKSSKSIEQYDHSDKKRANNPPVGLVSPENDPDTGKKTYRYDPHLDPTLQWAGKAEHTSFEVDTASLHVHERIDPRTIIDTVQRKTDDTQKSLFAEERPLREAIDFYKHKDNWSNRLIAGDSLLVMNSLLEKESMGGKVQMVYFDPPYGIKYGSNFQPFVKQRDVKDGKDEDLSAEPETIKAFRDTWELGIHSYLTYLRDRLLLAREMLAESGSVFVQISDENVHHVREIMDEIFGMENFVIVISFKTTSGFPSKTLSRAGDYIVQYAKDISRVKHRQLYTEKGLNTSGYNKVLLSNGDTRAATVDEKQDLNLLPKGAKLYSSGALFSEGKTEAGSEPYIFKGQKYFPSSGHWKTSMKGLDNLQKHNRIEKSGNTIRYRRFIDDFPVVAVNNMWDDTQTFTSKLYVVQTNERVIQRCLLMTTDPGDLVLDITCGSGTTAYVAEQWGRRWITCDTSRVALALSKQRLMTALFDYYKLAIHKEGVGSGFEYETVPHVTLKSIAHNEPPATETLYDKPKKDTKKTRITGPFTVEAVPAPYARSTYELREELKQENADASIARSDETHLYEQWRDELLRTGVRTKGGNKIEFSRVEPHQSTRYIHAEAETKEDNPQRVYVVFGPEHAPMEPRQAEAAWQEARDFRPDILLFCAFQFDPEAAKDIDALSPEKIGMRLLRADMNDDLLTQDLRKGSRSNESFWLVGEPDVKIHKLDDGTLQVEVLGFDYYNPKEDKLEHGNADKIAIWMLDTNYDGRSLFPSQVFFPMSSPNEGWARLAKNLKAEIDEEKIEAFRGTKSLPFNLGDNNKIAVKIIDDRGIESLFVEDV